MHGVPVVEEAVVVEHHALHGAGVQEGCPAGVAAEQPSRELGATLSAA